MAGRPQITTVTAPGTSPGMAIDLTKFRYGIGLVIGLSTGGSTLYTVECTGDQLPRSDADKIWVPLPLLVNKTTSLTSNLAYPVTAIRLNVASLVGTLQLCVVTA